MKYPVMIEKEEKGSRLVYADNVCAHDEREPFCYLDDLCMNHGSSMNGRKTAFCKLTGAVQKACIMISERSQEIYMPLLSDQNPENIWVLYQAIVSVRKSEKGCTVVFENGMRQEFPVDPRVIRLQMKRCSAFLDKINDPETF